MKLHRESMVLIQLWQKLLCRILRRLPFFPRFIFFRSRYIAYIFNKLINEIDKNCMPKVFKVKIDRFNTE